MFDNALVFTGIGILPADAVEELRELETPTGCEFLAVQKRSGGPFAGVELALPTAFFVLIGSAYATAFFAELGKEHSKKFTNTLSSVASKLLSKRISHKEKKYSLIFSIEAKICNIPAKLVFPVDASDEQRTLAVEYFLRLVEGKLETADQALVAKIVHDPAPFGKSVVAFDPARACLRRLDLRSGEFEAD
jgi:hypothetical protein